MRTRHWIALVALAIGSLGISACSGVVPEDLSISVQSAEASELEFTGPVDAIGTDAWTIGGLTVNVSGATDISGQPQVGDFVKVHAAASLDSGLLASEIELLPNDPTATETPVSPPAPGQEIEFVGAVVSIGPDSWTVGDQVLAVTSETEIKGALAVGDLAKVHATVQDDLTLLATEIEPASSDEMDLEGDSKHEDDEEELHFTGTVESIAPDVWMVAGLAFQILPETEIKDAIIVGDQVEIKAVMAADGTLTALEIELHDEEISNSGQDQESEDEHEDEHEDDHGSGSEDSHGGSSGSD